MDPALVEVLNDGFDQFVSSLGDNVTNISLSLVGSLSNIASSLPAFLVKILLMIISTFFIAIDFDVLSTFMLRQFSTRGNEIIQMIKQYLINILFVVIRSYALISMFLGANLIGIIGLFGFPIALSLLKHLNDTGTIKLFK